MFTGVDGNRVPTISCQAFNTFSFNVVDPELSRSGSSKDWSQILAKTKSNNYFLFYNMQSVEHGTVITVLNYSEVILF